ncbi:MAG: 30S ribosomal protein S18 [Phycisphaerae bacterium]|jgi:small subunit ribosomal protein S18|nr:30S ribosomal protein S18 [Phycisphaerae bacterium]
MSARYLPKQKPRKRKTRRTTESTRFRAPRLKPEEIDYKDVAMLQRLTSAQGKLFSRKRTGLDAKCQRKVALALKRARFLALMPYVT